MKKVITVLLLLLFLVGCSNQTRQIDEERYNTYLSYYQAILEADNKQTTSQCFDIVLVVNKIDDGYRYDIIIDNPRVVMLEIKALAIIDDLSIEVDTENMMPSIGILDGDTYNMVPGQVNTEKYFMEGLDLSLTSDQSALRIGVLIEWKNSNESSVSREYFSLYAEYTETGE